jgi:hypothetical protein
MTRLFQYGGPRPGDRRGTSVRDILEESAYCVLDADEGPVRALALPGPEKVLAGFPGAHVQRPPNLLSAKRSLDPERALAAPVLAAFGPVAAVREMPPEQGQHAKEYRTQSLGGSDSAK